MFWSFFSWLKDFAVIKMKVLIIDDHPVFASAMESVLQSMECGIVADTASTVDAALERIETVPDLQFILLDLSFPGLDGFSLLRVLAQRKCPLPVIVVSARADPDVIRACIDAGAVGFIPKAYSAQEIREAIERILAGEIYLPAGEGLTAVPQASAGGAADELPTACRQLGIGNRTFQVLQCLAEGCTNKEIAQRVHISVHTVKAHLAKLFQCLHTTNRTDAVMEAVRLGLIEHTGTRPRQE
ncbi:MAG: response regulator transcription factor [Candidatus Competibacteraceae bacterium]|nr:response regulator transcription factor [Candidatus Competibacteraceae bacterium]